VNTAAQTRFGLVGAGGLGGPVAYALAAAGAARLAVCDDDVVELSNLQRQVQFSTADLGRPKVEALADELCRRGYPRTRVDQLAARFSAATAAALIDRADVVIDGSDNLATKFAVNDAAAAAGRPFVIAGVLRYTGQVLAVRPGRTGCYRCLFEAPPPDDDAESCADAGVLGAAVAVIGGVAARAALALARGDDDGAGAGTLQVFDDLRSSAAARTVRYRPRSGCPACAAAPVRPVPKEAS
jgi:molybdopterin-synthase adenylyltransferase